MAFKGVFSDDFYNAIHVLPASIAVNGPVASGTLTGVQLTGALEVDLAVGNGAATAQAYTTDTAVNIIAALNNALATAYKQGLGAFAAAVNPPTVGLPNLFNLSWTVTIENQGTTTASTLAGGTGVTIAAINAGMTANGTTIQAAASANTPVATRYVVVVNSPTTVTFTRVE
jgi:hypothetical protein